MSELNEDVVGVMVRCPSCYGEVPITECPADPERPFRCLRCRSRASETAARMTTDAETFSREVANRAKPTDMHTDSAAATGGSKGRGRTSQQSATSGTN